MNYKQILEQHLTEYLASINVSQPVVVSYSDFEDYQYQTPLGLSLVKSIKDFNAGDIQDFLLKKYSNTYESVDITGPGFVSVKFNLLDYTQDLQKPKTVLVDYCGVNIAKQMHIGHIRSMFIGDFIVRLHEQLGDNVVIQNHIGDWGNQFGFLIHYIQTNKLENGLTNKNLTEYYKLAYAKNEEDSEFAAASSKVAFQLQNNLDKDIYALWQTLVSISMSEAQKTFEELNLQINASHTQGESFYAPFCHETLNILIEKKIATKNEDGSVVVFFEDKSPLVLQKSNGNFLYAIYDLAAIKWRADHINPDKMVYVVDKRQALHFEQVFEIAHKADFVKDTIQLQHVGFGTILGKDKKPLKTKEGQSLYLDDLFAQGKSILEQDVHFINMDEKIKEEILSKTIVGGMKYYDLKFNKTQDYIFDWQHVLNFTGNSAPYIQNALVRIDSIFYKNSLEVMNADPIDWSFSWSKQEKAIIFQCQKTQELLGLSEKNYASQAICEHAIKVCQLFHKYYEGEKILGHADEKYKLQLLGQVYQQLTLLCDVLGIESYACQPKLLLNKDSKFHLSK